MCWVSFILSEFCPAFCRYYKPVYNMVLAWFFGFKRVACICVHEEVRESCNVSYLSNACSNSTVKIRGKSFDIYQVMLVFTLNRYLPIGTQLAFTCSKLTIEAVEKVVKLTIKTPEDLIDVVLVFPVLTISLLKPRLCCN